MTDTAYSFKLLDAVVFAAVLITGIISVIFINSFLYNGNPQTAVIEVNGNTYATYSLAEFTTPYIVEIKTEYGYNKVELASDGVCVIEADCKDKLDVLQGKITRPYQSIVCLPHRLIIYLKADSAEIDGVTA